MMMDTNTKIMSNGLEGDEEWWQAQRLMGPAAEMEMIGIVPSKSRLHINTMIINMIVVLYNSV